MTGSPDYRPGDVANGYVLGTDNEWHPVADASDRAQGAPEEHGPPAPDPPVAPYPPAAPQKSGRSKGVLVAVIVLAVLGVLSLAGLGLLILGLLSTSEESATTVGGDATSEASPSPGAEEPTAGAQAPPGQGGAGETVDISDVQVGDCFVDNTDIGADISTVQVVACTTAHNSEIILVDEAFFAAAQTMPSEKAMSEQAEPACLGALESYTGQAYADSEYDFWYIFPSVDAWKYARDRGLICVGVLTSGADSTESMKAG